MNDETSTSRPYEAPRIDERTPLEGALVIVTSNTDSSAAFRPL